MSIQVRDRAVALAGWSIQIPPLFSYPAPLRITARSSDRTMWNDVLIDGGKRSNTRTWRSAAIGLTTAEREAPSAYEGTDSYMLVGFAYPESDVDITEGRPDLGTAGCKKAGNTTNNDGCEKLAAAGDLGIVVVAVDDTRNHPFHMYLLLDMVDGLCTPYIFNQELVFYLPRFRVAHLYEKSRCLWWNLEIKCHVRALAAKNAEDSSDESTSDENIPPVLSAGESPDEEESLFVSSGESSEEEDLLSLSGKAKGVPYDDNDTGDDESAGESLEGEKEDASSQNDAGDPEASLAPTASFTDQLSQMTAFFATSQDLQTIDQTIRLHLARIRQQASQENAAMHKFVDLSKEWEGSDSHTFCVEISARGLLKKVPRLSEVTTIRNALISLNAELEYEWLGRFFNFAMVILQDEQREPIPQHVVNYAVLKSLELLATLTQSN